MYAIKQNVAILFSPSSRAAYIHQAEACGATYTFRSAWGDDRTWLKGEYAYLAPNGASVMLHRHAIKHDLITESPQLTDELSAYQFLLIPNAGHMDQETIATISAWLAQPDHHLLVTGKTNLPPALLGLRSLTPITPAGFTGWKWTDDSPYADTRLWEPYYISAYNGHRAYAAEAASTGHVLAELWEFSGDLNSATTAQKRRIGAGIVVSERVITITNQFFEFVAGTLQAHLNVEAIRHWHHPTHWGDTLAYFFKGILLHTPWARLWDVQLKPFGAYRGVLSLRHDVDTSADVGMLALEVATATPATWDIIDPQVSPGDASPEQAEIWLQETGKFDFLEAGLHNDSIHAGDPSRYLYGTGIYDHFQSSGRHLGLSFQTGGRHGACHLHPETIDAMDYLYARAPEIEGLCTFCFYAMVEYGVRHPEITYAGHPLTYITDTHATIATQGFWFPFHAVVSTKEEYKILRGWDLTHEYDCNYELIETVYYSHHSRRPSDEDRLENGVYTLQYHPLFTRDPAYNHGKGTLPYLAYAIGLADRLQYWIANKVTLYRHMCDYQDLKIRVIDPNCVQVLNPSPRSIEGFMLQLPAHQLPAAMWQVCTELGWLAHVVDGRLVTLPPLSPGQMVQCEITAEAASYPLIRQPGHKGLDIVAALYQPAQDNLLVNVRSVGQQTLLIENLAPSQSYHLKQQMAALEISQTIVANPRGQITCTLAGSTTHYETTQLTLTTAGVI